MPEKIDTANGDELANAPSLTSKDRRGSELKKSRELEELSQTPPRLQRTASINDMRCHTALGRQASLRKVKLGLTAQRITLEKQGSGLRYAGGEEDVAMYTPAVPANSEGNRMFDNMAILKDLMCEPINVMLLAGPIALYLSATGGSSGLTFWLSFTALVPMAKLLGDSTEHLAENLSDTMGGLLNATFGNATEMIITIKSIDKGLLDLVKKSLLGSILSNMLLVLGCSLFAGGIKRPGGQTFHNATGLINVTMLFVGIMSMSLPTISSFSQSQARVLKISRASAISVGVGYVAFLVHSLLEGDLEDESSKKPKPDAEQIAKAEKQARRDRRLSDIEEGTGSSERLGEEPEGDAEPEDDHPVEEGSEEDEEAVLDVPYAFALLLFSTMIVSILSEVMVGSIEGFMHEWGFPEDFVGVILLPIVGNACEHASAVRMAYNNKVAAAIAVAVGSSTQITLFVMPFSVITGWIYNQPLDFNMGVIGLSVQTFSCLAVFSIITDGHSTWLEGFMLMLAYVLVAVIYWYSESQNGVDEL